MQVTNRFASCDSLEELIYQAVGAASMCWENVDKAGIFDDSKAASVAKDLLDALKERCTWQTPQLQQDQLPQQQIPLTQL